MLKPAPSKAAQVGCNGAFPKSMNISINATTIEKIAGVWHTAEPMSILVVSWEVTAGCRAIPKQAAPAGEPDPIPDPIAPNPMLTPAPRRAAADKSVGFGTSRKSKRIAITRAKMEADSATAWPTSMFLKISPDILGLRATAMLAMAAVLPSPIAAPMAPNPIAMPPPVNAATCTIVFTSNAIDYLTCTEMYTTVNMVKTKACMVPTNRPKKAYRNGGSKTL